MFGDVPTFFSPDDGDGSFDPLDVVKQVVGEEDARIKQRIDKQDEEAHEEIKTPVKEAESTVSDGGQEPATPPATPADMADQPATKLPEREERGESVNASALADALADKKPEPAPEPAPELAPESQTSPKDALAEANFTFEGWDGDVGKLPESMRKVAEGVAGHYQDKIAYAEEQNKMLRELNDVLMTGDAKQILERAQQQNQKAREQLERYEKLVDTLEERVHRFEAAEIMKNYPDFVDSDMKLPDGTTVMDATIRLAEELGGIHFEHAAHLARMGSDAIRLAREKFQQYPGTDPGMIVDHVAHKLGKSYSQPITTQPVPEPQPEPQAQPTPAAPQEAPKKIRQTKARRGVSGASSDIRRGGEEDPPLTLSRRTSRMAEEAAERAFRTAS